MLNIDAKNNITLTKGDSLTISLTLTKRNGEAYTPEAGDTIRFAVSKGYLGDAHYDLKYTQNIPTDTLSLTVPASETKKLECGDYNYDIQITHNDGFVDTFISAKLKITGEVE